MRFVFSASLLALLPVPTWAAPTYTKDVAPILWQQCAGCHRPGEVGPFSLLTYKDAAKRADFIVEVTASKQMPPWKAEPGFGTFHDERRLTPTQLKTLAAWAKAGAPEGDPADLPPAPQFTDGWQLGTPDLVIKMPEAFKISATGKDIYQCFVMLIPTDSDKTLRAVEFRPGNRSVVHHAILYLDKSGAARKKDAATPEPGYRSFAGPGIIPSGSLGAWTPGSTVQPSPDNVGRFLSKGSDLVLQIHYHPSGKDEMDQSQIGIYFTPKLADNISVGIGLRGKILVIPAGVKRFHVTGETEPLPADVLALNIAPHMHMLGREMKVEAHLPTGGTVPLIWIKDWDFSWQGSYNYAQPVPLPKGTVIKMDAYYDNSADNPRNPSSPPKLVHWGEQTQDEMCLCGISVTTKTRADLKAIAGMRNNRLGTLLGGGVPPGILAGDGKMDKDDNTPLRDRLRELLKKREQE
jgi:hypothetical protein